MIILLPAALCLLGLCIYTAMMSLHLQELDFKDLKYPPSASISREAKQSLDTTWNTMIEKVFQCNKKIEANISNDADIYLCTNDEYGSYYDREAVGYKCRKFLSSQNDFCNGVFDFPINAAFDLKPSYDTDYFLSDCNV